jgi:hypothetical protein
MVPSRVLFMIDTMICSSALQRISPVHFHFHGVQSPVNPFPLLYKVLGSLRGSAAKLNLTRAIADSNADWDGQQQQPVAGAGVDTSSRHVLAAVFHWW